MNNYFTLSREQQRLLLQQAVPVLHLPAQAIEKDIWVSTILQIVFTLPFADKLIFKGGTSLSKAWNLISRFSEDIDLAIDRTLFGLSGDLTKKKIKQLRKQSSLFVKESFLKELQTALHQYGLANLCTLSAQPDGEGDDTYPEPRTVFVSYQSAFEERLQYLSPVVKLEIGARSLFEPFENIHVGSLIEPIFPTIQTSLVNTSICTAIPAKTFLEKVFLLHELFSVEGHGIQVNRRSRHLYDLWKMMDKPFAIDAIHDDNLWETIRHHREIFTSVSAMNYSLDIRKNLTLVPREDIRANWESDYESMSSAMIYGDKPTFDALCDQMRVLQERFKQ